VRFERDKVSFDLGEWIRQYRRKLTDEEQEKRGTKQSWTQVRRADGNAGSDRYIWHAARIAEFLA
jgi:hypothetical protein